MTRTPFATLMFRGGRFGEGAMPLEALPELTAYRDLLAAVARELFFLENPERVRLPKGFDASFRLTLSRIESGSAVPLIEREFDTPPLFPGDHFDRARNEVERAIGTLGTGAAFPAWLKPAVAARFSSFGRTLREDETVVIAQAGKREGAVYDRRVRRAILVHSQGTYEEDVDLVGVVRATDADQDKFEIRLADDRRIPVGSSRPFFDAVLKSLGSESAVRVSGTGVYDAEGKLLRIAQANDVSAAEEGDVASGRAGCRIPIDEQVQSLAALRDGWLDGEGRAFDAEGLAWSAKLLRSMVDGLGLATPHIYPTPDGRVRAEWSRAKWEISAELDPVRKTSEVRSIRLDADEMHERTFSLTEPGQELLLGSFLASQLRGDD